MSYMLASVLAVGNFDITAHNGVDGDWDTFNAQVRALGRWGTIENVSAAGEWDDRFDIVRGEVSGFKVTIYGPRYRSPQPMSRNTAGLRPGKVMHDAAERDLVRQIEREVTR